MEQSEQKLEAVQRIKSDITKNFPDFEIRTIEKLGEGWMSEAFMVNEEWVFRFPKAKAGAEDLQKEIKILPLLAKHVTLTIPQFEYVGEQQSGLPFVGYKSLPGEILGEATVPTLPKEEQEVIARQLAQFIDEVSAFPSEEAKQFGVTVNDHRKDYTDTFEEVTQKVFPLIDEDMKRYISSRFETYLGNPENFDYTPTLTHADLSPDHFVANPETHELTGIIDFGDLIIGDPDYEYSYLFMDCGEDFTRRVMELRGETNIEERLKKVSIFVTVDHIGTLLEGMRRVKQDWIGDSIAIIRKEMKK